MYRGFELSLPSKGLLSDKTYAQLKQQSRGLYKEFHEETLNNIANLKIDTTSVINGDVVENAWFPKEYYTSANTPDEPFHIFLSHSHLDKEFAMCIAQLLKNQANINVFIDSLVWGYRNELIEKLYASALEQDLERTGLRDSIVSHVDCMLSKSLMEMIDSCECMFFLNTPQSVSAFNVSKGTLSPWIYSELEASAKLGINTPDRIIAQHMKKYATVHDEKPYFRMEHNVSTRHLTKIDNADFCAWLVVMQADCHTPGEALDLLYEMKD